MTRVLYLVDNFIAANNADAKQSHNNVKMAHSPENCAMCHAAQEAYVAMANAAKKTKPEPEEETVGIADTSDEPENPEGKRRDEFRMTRTAMNVVELTIAELPNSAGKMAGYLNALTFYGDATDSGNALAKYLHVKIQERGSYLNYVPVKVHVTSSHIIIETKTFQVVAAAPAKVAMFMTMLVNGEYPELVV